MGASTELVHSFIGSYSRDTSIWSVDNPACGKDESAIFLVGRCSSHAGELFTDPNFCQVKIHYRGVIQSTRFCVDYRRFHKVTPCLRCMIHCEAPNTWVVGKAKCVLFFQIKLHLVGAFSVVRPPKIMYINRNVMYKICYTGCDTNYGTPFPELLASKQKQIKTWMSKNGVEMHVMTKKETRYLEHNANDQIDEFEYKLPDDGKAQVLLPNHKNYIHGQAVPYDNLWSILIVTNAAEIDELIREKCPNFISGLYVLVVAFKRRLLFIVHYSKRFFGKYLSHILKMIGNPPRLMIENLPRVKVQKKNWVVQNKLKPENAKLPTILRHYWDITPEAYVENILIFIKSENQDSQAVIYYFNPNRTVKEVEGFIYEEVESLSEEDPLEVPFDY